MTYKIHYDTDGTPFAVEVNRAGRIVAAEPIFEESLESMNLTHETQVDIEDYLGAGDPESGQYATAQYNARVLFDV